MGVGDSVALGWALMLPLPLHRWRVPGARRPGRGPEALERLSAAARHGAGALAHADQRAAPCSWGPALGLSRTAAAQHRPLGPGLAPNLRTSVLHVYTGWMPCPALPVLFCEVSVAVGLSACEGYGDLYSHMQTSSA